MPATRLLAGALVCATLSVPGNAHAAAPGPLDRPCTHTPLPDRTPGADPRMWVGPLQGGPVAQNGTLRCTIQLDAPQHLPPAPSDIHLTATGTSGTTTVPPDVMAYVKEPWQLTYVCTTFDDGTATWYYDGSAWSASAAVSCQVV